MTLKVDKAKDSQWMAHICLWCVKLLSKFQLQLQEWTDSNMRWNVSEYNGVKDIRVPPSNLWKPDILMYNRWSQGKVNGHLSIGFSISVPVKRLTLHIPQMWWSVRMGLALTFLQVSGSSDDKAIITFHWPPNWTEVKEKRNWIRQI